MSRDRWRGLLRCVLPLLACAPAGAADWLRVQNPQVEILTDAGERAGRAALDRFDRIRRVFTVSGAGPLSLRVFLFNSEKEFRAFTDNPNIAGFYQRGFNRDYIVLHGAAGLTRVVAHEYVHFVLSRGPPLPRWFEEGTAELYSNLDFQRGRMLAGSPIPAHLSTLAAGRWLSAAELRELRRRDETKLEGMFYAETWALVHMINLAPGWREHMPMFAGLLTEGRDGDQAFQEAFGKSMDQAVAELHGYIGNIRGAFLDAPAGRGENSVEVSPAATLDTMFARAELALTIRHTEQARQLFEEAKRSQPESPAAEAGLGLLAMAEDRRDAARAHFQRAIDMGGRDAETYFQLAMLERDAGARAQSDDLLRRAVALNLDFGEAHFLLGSEAGDDGDWEAALEHLRSAAAALPRKSYVWHALGYAEAQLGLADQARVSAARALRTADTEQEERMAEALRDSLR